MRAAARLILAMAELPTAVAAGSRCGEACATATVGVLDVVPNSPNVIPGEVVVVTDLRSADPSRLAALIVDQ